MKKFLYIFIVATPISLFSQPLITDPDKLSIGTVLKFMNCDETTAIAGSGGANKTWDFTGLVDLQDTILVKIMSAASAPHGNQFPAATIAKEISTGEILYMQPTSSGNQLYGLVSTNTISNLNMNYTDPEKTSEQPITFGTSTTDSFIDDFTSAGFNFKGSGTTEISGDGYGTLILPGRTFSNTLRVKIDHKEIDTLMQFGSVSPFNRVTYKWYDVNNRAPLLEIDSINTTNTIIKTIKYLLYVPLTTGIEKFQQAEYFFYPNPADKEINIHHIESGRLIICNTNGIALFDKLISENETSLKTEELPDGVYVVRFQSERSRFIKKLIVQH